MIKLISLALLFLPATASAHSEFQSYDFITGFLHPFTGLDHMSTMIGVGIVAAILGGNTLWRLPLKFIIVMLIGALSAIAGIGFGAVEMLIATSVLAVGIMLVFSEKLTVMTKAVSVTIMIFAVFHGYAHASEMQMSSSVLLYFTGFVVGTASLHTLGGIAGCFLISHKFDNLVFKIIGGVMALFGGVLLIS